MSTRSSVQNGHGGGMYVRSIAVLPFTNLSAAPENEYFCDGLAEELLNALTRVSDLRVVARTSAFSLKHLQLDVQEIGRRLNAAVVLEGSVQRTGNRVRILTQLISTADGYQLTSLLLAYVYAGLGDRENFFKSVNRAHEERDPILVWLKILPEYDAMRSDPRYNEVLRRMGLA